MYTKIYSKHNIMADEKEMVIGTCRSERKIEM